MSEGARLSADVQSSLFADAAEVVDREIRTLRQALLSLRKEQSAWAAGAAGERAAASAIERVLVDLGSAQWHLLRDRRWPGTRRANVDLLLVGPPGVLVIDVKRWRAPRIEGGRLWRGDEDQTESLDHVAAQADAVAAVLAETGLAPPAVMPILLLIGHATPPLTVAEVVVMGDRAISRDLLRFPRRLDDDGITSVTTELDRLCPPAVDAVVAPPGSALAGSASPSQPPTTPVEHASIDPPTAYPEVAPVRPAKAGDSMATCQTMTADSPVLEDLWAGVLEEAARERIESWMTWLHPEQRALVTRAYGGPARVRGPAGTGKTVVALHRARHLAADPNARILVTSFVRTLPQVQASLFRRLAPERAARVEFVGLHAWAMRVLQRRGRRLEIAPGGGRGIFDAVWREVGLTTPLATMPVSQNYWWQEVQSVIKGRGLASADDYVSLVRVGRRLPLREDARRTVWLLFAAYQQRLTAGGLVDFSDVISEAYQAVRAQPVEPAYTSVIVDEVQDLTCQGMRLLHAIVGDRPDGLYLVGDGQQSVYPGGFTLGEAGLSVTGRSAVLSTNYRNRSDIVRAALEVVAGDGYDDLEDSAPDGARDVLSARPGGHVLRVISDDEASQRVALLNALHHAANAGIRHGDMAILLPDRIGVRRWLAYLTGAQLPSRSLEEYDGVPTDEIKVGTYLRAKGLEFACVFLPDADRAVSARSDSESPEEFDERAALARRTQFVAMTRARDRLWLGSVRG